jgi:hypothetical protein
VLGFSPARLAFSDDLGVGCPILAVLFYARVGVLNFSHLFPVLDFLHSLIPLFQFLLSDF